MRSSMGRITAEKPPEEEYWRHHRASQPGCSPSHPVACCHAPGSLQAPTPRSFPPHRPQAFTLGHRPAGWGPCCCPSLPSAPQHGPRSDTNLCPEKHCTLCSEPLQCQIFLVRRYADWSELDFVQCGERTRHESLVREEKLTKAPIFPRRTLMPLPDPIRDVLTVFRARCPAPTWRKRMTV